MIVESQLKQWEELSKFRNMIMMDIHPSLVLLLIEEVRNQRSIIEHMANVLGNSSICTHAFSDCDKDRISADDCTKCWIKFTRQGVDNGSLRDTLP